MRNLPAQEARDRWSWKPGIPAIAGFCAILSYQLLTLGLLLSAGLLDSTALGLVLAALGVALAGCCLRWKDALTAAAAWVNPWGVALTAVLAFAGYWLVAVGVATVRHTPLTPFVAGAVPLTVLAGSYAWRSAPWPRARVAALLVIGGLLGIWHIRSSPPPRIDVWRFQQEGCQLLCQGRNPYAAEYADVLHEPNVYGRAVYKDGWIRSCPYPPLSLLLVLPGYLAGDVRYSLLLALIGAAALVIAVGRNLGLPPGHVAELAAVTLVCHPLGFAVVERAWTEPLVLLAGTFSVWAVTARREWALVLGLGALLAVKQYAVLWLIPLLACRQVRWETAWKAAVVAAGINLPFFLWDPAAFWRGMVTFQVDSPFRGESLTVLAATAAHTGRHLPAALGFLAAAAVATLVAFRAPPCLTTANLGAAAIFLAFFAFSKGAHLNYYWFTGAILPLAIVCSARERVANQARASSDGIQKNVPSTRNLPDGL
jgi:hypothetical protein